MIRDKRLHEHTATAAADNGRSPVLIRARGLTVAYGRARAIRDISFEVRAGERVAIIGPNGAGKSTLIQTLLGLLQPQSGSVELIGLEGRQIGYVPQQEGVNWDFPVTVRDVVMLGRVPRVGWFRRPGRADRAAVNIALERVNLASLADRQVGELSGGQRRRVFIARALAQEARLLALDEPFSGVDVQAQSSLMDVLDSLNRDGMTILLSTHDLNLAFTRFDRVLALRHELIAYGPPAEVYTREVLAQMYGGLTVLENGHGAEVYIDDHGCEVC